MDHTVHAAAVGGATSDEEVEALVDRALARLEERVAALGPARRGPVQMAVAAAEHRVRVVAWCHVDTPPAG